MLAPRGRQSPPRMLADDMDLPLEAARRPGRQPSHDAAGAAGTRPAGDPQTLGGSIRRTGIGCQGQTRVTRGQGPPIESDCGSPTMSQEGSWRGRSPMGHWTSGAPPTSSDLGLLIQTRPASRSVIPVPDRFPLVHPATHPRTPPLPPGLSSDGNMSQPTVPLGENSFGVGRSALPRPPLATRSRSVPLIAQLSGCPIALSLLPASVLHQSTDSPTPGSILDVYRGSRVSCR
jgi:hypothetical protein